LKTLHEIGLFYGTDKATHHNYLNFYESYFNKLRNKKFNLLEIGVYKGNSVMTWLEYFNECTIYAIDVDIKKFNNERVKEFKISQDDPKILDLIRDINFDIIIDDGSHKVLHQLKSLNMLWDHVSKGGFYVIEDIHTSFYKEYIDFNPTTFQILKDLKNSIFHESVEQVCKINKIKNEINSINFFSNVPDNIHDSNTCLLEKK